MTMPTRYAVVTGRNRLMPLAKQIRNEIGPGADVALLTLTKEYQHSWEGLLEARWQAFHRDEGLKGWGLVGEELLAGERTLVGDFWLRPLLEACAAVPHKFVPVHESKPTPFGCAVGAWWDGSAFSLYHWFVPDWGLMPGGLGAQVVAGGTLVAAPDLPDQDPGRLLATVTQDLVEADFRGLVQMVVDYNRTTQQWEVVDWRGGWPEVHSDLFVWQAGSVVQLLTGIGQREAFPRQYTVGTVVSQAPWPYRALDLNLVASSSKEENSRNRVDRAKLKVKPVTVNLPPGLREFYRFHGVKLDEDRVMTDGVDGMLGVAVADGNLLAQARRKVALAAAATQLPNLQYRSDVGHRVETFLATLEAMGLW